MSKFLSHDSDKPMIFFFAGLVFGTFFMGAMVLVFVQMQTNGLLFDEAPFFGKKSPGEILFSIFAFFATIVGGYFLYVRTAAADQTAKSTVRGETDERFKNAAMMMASNNEIEAAAGIELIKRMAHVDPDNFKRAAKNILYGKIRQLSIIHEDNIVRAYSNPHFRDNAWPAGSKNISLCLTAIYGLNITGAGTEGNREFTNIYVVGTNLGPDTPGWTTVGNCYMHAGVLFEWNIHGGMRIIVNDDANFVNCRFQSATITIENMGPAWLETTAKIKFINCEIVPNVNGKPTTLNGRPLILDGNGNYDLPLEFPKRP